MNTEPTSPLQNPPENTQPPPVPSAIAQQGKGWAGKRLTFWWFVGLTVMATFAVWCSLVSARISGASVAYAAGVVIGSVFWPAFIAAIFAMFDYFRKAPRRLAVVAMIMFGLVGLSNMSAALQKRMSYGAIADTMRDEIKDMQRQFIQTDDPGERAAVLQRVEALINNAADKVSSQQAADEMRAMAKFIEPIFEQRRAYDAALLEFLGEENDWSKYTSTQESLALGRERLAKLRQCSKAVYQTMDSLVAKAATMIRNNDASLGISVAAFKGFHSSYVAKAQKFKDVGESHAQMLARMDDALAMLQTEWGKWSKGTDGVFQWENDELSEKFLAINSDIDALGAQLNEREKALHQ